MGFSDSTLVLKNRMENKHGNWNCIVIEKWWFVGNRRILVKLLYFGHGMEKHGNDYVQAASKGEISLKPKPRNPKTLNP